MVDDDFMYTRREKPRDIFVDELLQKLKQKEKSLKPRMLLMRVASMIVGIIGLSITLLIGSPQVRALVGQSLGIEGWVIVSEDDAQEYFPFAVPQIIPDGYERYTEKVGDNTGDVLLSGIDYGQFYVVLGHIIWRNEASKCQIMMIVLEDRSLPEAREQSMERNEYFAERYDWIEVFDVVGVRGVWRLQSSSTGASDKMEIEWTSEDNILHHIETTTDCMTKDEFITFSQSSQ